MAPSYCVPIICVTCISTVRAQTIMISLLRFFIDLMRIIISENGMRSACVCVLAYKNYLNKFFEFFFPFNCSL